MLLVASDNKVLCALRYKSNYYCVGAKIPMFIADEEAEETMLSWDPGSSISDAVIWYVEYLDKAARRITIGSATLIQ
jgi:hypothetical protein